MEKSNFFFKILNVKEIKELLFGSKKTPKEIKKPRLIELFKKRNLRLTPPPRCQEVIRPV